MFSSKTRNYMLILLSGGMLSSCGWVDKFAANWSMEEQKYSGVEVSNWSNGRAPAPGENVIVSDRSDAPEISSGLKVPEGIADLSPVKSLHSNINRSPRGLSEKLILANNNDIGKRINDLENAVSMIRDDMNRIVPVLAKLSRTESELTSVISYLKTQASQNLSGPVRNISVDRSDMKVIRGDVVAKTYDSYGRVEVSEDSEPMEVAYLMAEIEPTSGVEKINGNEYHSFVNKIRFGEHPNKTRIVVDVTSKVEFTTDLDNEENILIIDIKDTGWNAGLGDLVRNSNVISSYLVQNIDGQEGSRLILELREQAIVKFSELFAPHENGKRGYRVVVDIGVI